MEDGVEFMKFGALCNPPTTVLVVVYISTLLASSKGGPVQRFMYSQSFRVTFHGYVSIRVKIGLKCVCTDSSELAGWL